MPTIKYLEWRKCGLLSDESFEEHSGGTYLMIYEGNPKRIFYVGKADDFGGRWKYHRTTLLRDHASTFWRVMVNEDIYDLMAYKDSPTLNMQAYYEEQAAKSRLWGATKEYGLNGCNHSDTWTEDWEKAAKLFAKNIRLWACPTTDLQQDMKYFLETQIQQAIGNYFSLGYYPNDDSQNWLGDQPRRGRKELRDYIFCFKSLPDVDVVSQHILLNMNRYLNCF